MAAIDKIFIKGWDNYCKFRDWIEKQPEISDKYGEKVKLIDYFRKFTKKEWGPKNETHPVMNNPYFIDAYIIRNCPFDFVQEELMVNYGYWSQDRILEYYDNIKNWKGDGECPYWAKLEDFTFNDDGTVTLRGVNEDSTYQGILNNEVFTKPYRENVEFGTHYRMTMSPKNFGHRKYNYPFKGWWFVDIQLPNKYDFMHHHDYDKKNGPGTWDFSDDFVNGSTWSSSCAYVKSIRTLKRYLKIWKLPVGAKVIVRGYFDFEKYEFIIKK